MGLLKGSNFIAFVICRSKVKIATMHMATESSFSNFKNILSIKKRNQLHWNNSLYYLWSRILLKSKSYACFSWGKKFLLNIVTYTWPSWRISGKQSHFVRKLENSSAFRFHSWPVCLDLNRYNKHIEVYILEISRVFILLSQECLYSLQMSLVCWDCVTQREPKQASCECVQTYQIT